MKTVMALAMALSMIAVTGAVTYWDGVEDSSAVDANGVTISGNQIFANGIPIKIVEDEEGKTVIKSGTWNGDSPGDVWTNVDTGTLNLSACTVFGGSLNGNVDKTYIQMDGGKIGNIAGGGKTDSAVKYTTQSATIIINGGTVGYVAGGGYAPTDGEIGSGYVTDTTEKMSNVTVKATITMNGGTVSALIGGGYRSYAYVGETTIEFTNGTVGELIAGGINGYTGKSTVTIDGGVVKNGGYGSKGLITSANRGEVKDVSITVKDLGAGSNAYSRSVRCPGQQAATAVATQS